MSGRTGLGEKEIWRVKKEEITLPLKKSIQENGRKPSLFRTIVAQATICLKNMLDRWKAPPKPVLKVDMMEFRKMQMVKEKMLEQARAIKRVEQEQIPQLQKRLDSTKGIFKGKERKEAEENLEDAKERLFAMKSHYNSLVRECGFETVHSFMQVYQRFETEIVNYQKAVEQYKTHGGQKPPERESIQEKLRILTEEAQKREYGKEHQIKRDRGAR